ncbi:MAG: cohesin domain-containing protein, partial [Bacteroidota bacterium]
AGSTDNCSETLFFSFDENYLQSQNKTFSCADLQDLPFSETLGYLYEATIYVTEVITRVDGSTYINQDFCTVPLYIQDNEGYCQGNFANIAGRIETEEGDDIEDVQVDLTQNSSPMNNFVTDVDGMYSFFSLPEFANYEVRPSNNDDPLNGVSTYDIVLIQKHLLGIAPLDSPYKLIAADINSSTNISAIDMVELRRLILGIYQEFPNNRSWRFVDDSFEFADRNDPWPFREVAMFNPLQGNQINTDFTGIKIGDINGTVVANSLLSGTPRGDMEDLVFAVEEQEFEAGDVVSVDVRANNFEEIEGYQFTLDIADQKLKLQDINSGKLTMDASNFGTTMESRGMITTSWSDFQGVSADANEVLFTLEFTAQEAGRLSEVLKVSSRYTRAEAYQNGEFMDVALDFVSGEAAELNFHLYQNEPNPFNEYTLIGFMLPESMNGSITVYDVSGRVLKVIEGSYTKGYNEEKLLRKDVAASGVLYYQFDSEQYSATKKMVVVE